MQNVDNFIMVEDSNTYPVELAVPKRTIARLKKHNIIFEMAVGKCVYVTVNNAVEEAFVGSLI